MYFKDNPEGVQFIFRIILEKDDITAISVETQSDFKSLTEHSLAMDLVAEDSTGKRYDIEIQRGSEGATAEHASYQSTVPAANSLPAGREFSEKAETYVIFLTEKDVWQGNCPIYHVERSIREMPDKVFREKYDFLCEQAAETHYEELAARVRYFQRMCRGVSNMCAITEPLKKKVAQKVILKPWVSWRGT